MNTASQEEFIHKIKIALGKPLAESQRNVDFFKSDMSDETRGILERIKNRTPEERKKLLATLIEAAGPINLKVISCEDINSVTAAIADLVRDKDPEWGAKKSVVAWQHPLIENLNLPEA
ncbi:MAG: hypothetical protein KAS40_12475, partial [Desulfobacterales bacterium]|nr:hypothetical protein [Desulfobacterales bacterium]